MANNRALFFTQKNMSYQSVADVYKVITDLLDDGLTNYHGEVTQISVRRMFGFNHAHSKLDTFLAHHGHTLKTLIETAQQFHLERIELSNSRNSSNSKYHEIDAREKAFIATLDLGNTQTIGETRNQI